LHDAVNYAVRYGVLVIAAAGNLAGDTPFYPAAYHETIAVSGTDQFDQRYLRSTFGPPIDLAAPAVSIYSTYIQDHQSTYAYMSGTSMAAPHVAGLAALVLAADPALDAAAVEQLMREHVIDLGEAGWDPLYGYGRIDALQTLRAMEQVAWPSDTFLQRSVQIPLLLHDAGRPSLVGGGP
jgi:subtilisin family serine protease